MSDVYSIELNRKVNKNVSFVGEASVSVPKQIFKTLNNHVFVDLGKDDLSIIQKIVELKAFDLKTSTFGLGVVTGDNKTKLLKTKTPDSEHIYTGKEVEKYKLLTPKNYIVFNRDNLQQVAPDEIYRTSAKLVYKTISKRLKVALDITGSLTSNSANLIIPRLPGYDIVSVMAFLNTDLYSYLHLKLFGGVNKIAKENLAALPFPAITTQQNKDIIKLTKAASSTGNDLLLQKYIDESIFGLNQTERNYIKDHLH
jgi:hypothetical protein